MTGAQAQPPRILVTMATGAGNTIGAFQICWQLWSSRWNRIGEHRRPRIFYLADRNILVDDPKNCDSRRAQAAAHRRPRQRERDRAARWRRAAVAGCRGGVAGAAVYGVELRHG